MYNDKKNTSGRLWIRRKDYPFSYPAFANSALCPDAEIEMQFTILSNTLSPYLAVSTPTEFKNSDDGGIYDFEFTKDKSYIALVVRNNKDGVVKRYDNASLMVSYI